MTTTPHDPTRYRVSIVDEDPLRARKEARELLAGLTGTDPDAGLDLPRQRTPSDRADKGGLSVDTVGVLISAGSLVAASVQAWLARVPQRTIVVTRPDGATLHITGKEAREDDEQIKRFLAGGIGPAYSTNEVVPSDDENSDGSDDGTAGG